MNQDLEQAKKLLKERSLAFAVVKDGEVVGTSVSEGVADLLALMESKGATLAGASLADKLVGKAVAAVVCHMDIKAVYAIVLSHSALEMLQRHDVPLEYNELVPMILSRDRKVRGPLEELLLDIQDPDEAVAALGDFLHHFKADK